MDSGLGAFCYTYESVPFGEEDFPRSEDPVFILGRPFSTLYDYDDLKLEVLSKVWISYRRGFSAIGGVGPTSDNGWGCMLRCGQMMLCNALMKLHLPHNWTWNRKSLHNDPVYRRIIELFLDQKSAGYSIHQIAAMGVSEGKDVGKWFGPNTIAHVLKKLVAYDSWSRLVLHVAMDNTLVIDDILTLCHTPYTSSGVELQFDPDTKKELPTHLSPHASFTAEESVWRPLLLMIPLRLGLSSINDVYIHSLKKFFELPQSVGMVGGKPNQALWFIGYTGDELVFLDPHTTQPVVEVCGSGELWDDSSYHCSIAGRMKITSLDPSLAVGFFCKTELQFVQLIQDLEKDKNLVAPMFEVCRNRPTHWPPVKTANPHGTDEVFTVVPSPKYDTDDEYELV